MSSAAKQVIAATATISALSTICVIFRFTVLHFYRARTRRSMACHLLLFAGCVFDWTANSTSIWTLLHEIKDPESFAKWQIPEGPRKALFGGAFIYLIALIVVKGGYLVYFSELLVGVHTRKRWLFHGATVVWTVTSAIALLLHLLWCQPMSGNWKVTDFRNCPSMYNHKVFIITFSLMIVSDIAILVVPLSIISSLKFKRSRRLQFTGIAFVFAIGLLSAAATTVKLAVVQEAVHSGGMRWALVRTTMVWSQIELFAAILAITLPTLGWSLGMARRKLGWISTTEPSGGPGSGGIVASASHPRRMQGPAGQAWVTSETDLVRTLRRGSEGSGDSRKGEMVLMETRNPHRDDERGVEVREGSLER